MIAKPVVRKNYKAILSNIMVGAIFAILQEIPD